MYILVSISGLSWLGRA